MNRRQLLQTTTRAVFLAASAMFSMAAQAQAQASGPEGSKVAKLVLQVSDSDPAKWNLALNNAKNVQEELGAANVSIAIVAYGPGIGMLKMDAAVNSRVSAAVKSGVRMVACENTMRAQKLAKDDMHPAISYANAGVTEIMKLQSQGWAYVRP
jgi:intracellular sulfur oxidation DsrE/DsrF family protein